MSPLWILALAVTFVGAMVVFVALRRTRDELEPTVEAFAGLREALRPQDEDTLTP